ncbi:hypothetical protein COCSUDRAFT_33402 [Coccomyxa subellipsoidea C-169]|uniref:Uncharacterized protein n=1 Tax=Coccomyxa subellipsoidea (strain C-169) TaxID=574566 RepID=I0YWR3_COCSC|nr:hypothetical protein COCSUDRAFT_33402 [Coccomyxa subellipsoidea C-169]EIE22832.1 hypothetical protein COCSUDRAFT_33402 [Coccomyxa subellipsoidea C-169]|eukprot:XP_005647376.1 hypothetical protein COCSUDRAFT_33402 [Coccomyxa subellipsoidea C-169]
MMYRRTNLCSFASQFQCDISTLHTHNIAGSKKTLLDPRKTLFTLLHRLSHLA